MGQNHSHSMILRHGNALNSRRKFFPCTQKHRSLVRQKIALLISNTNLGVRRFARFRQLSASIGRFTNPPAPAVSVANLEEKKTVTPDERGIRHKHGASAGRRGFDSPRQRGRQLIRADFLLVGRGRPEGLDLVSGSLGDGGASREFPGRTAQPFPERCAESARGFVADLVSDPVERFRAADQRVFCQRHPPARKILDWTAAEDLTETSGESRAREPGDFRQARNRPIGPYIRVHRAKDAGQAEILHTVEKAGPNPDFSYWRVASPHMFR
ncbi:MAG TPA: hypothetical protein VMB34_15710 [Acetobacteraceae bacterium]|nr:hypothetical protein [Acetobacteraceae bacterium]